MKEILVRLAMGNANTEQKEKFSLWIDTLSDEEYEDVLLEWERIVSEINTDAKADEALLNVIHNRIMADQNQEHGMVRTMQHRRWWWAAAAAILVLLTSTYFLWSSSEKDHATPIAKSSKVNDIAPGGNKAILTLADGTKVILDSANNGTITKQGNVTIIKLNDGQLAYKPSTLNPQSSTTDRLSTVLYNTISTPRGGQYQLVLADGSKVWLNAASSIRFPNAFPGNDRKVEITGEAYFEVAHNAAKPFYVSAGGMEVKVLGTHFNVNAYTDEPSVRTTLLQGSVQVVNGSHSKILVPGEQAQVGSNGNIKTSQVDVNEVVAWKNGKFVFDNANIHSIMRQLEKWYDIDVVYQATDTNETFMGSISRDVNCSQILDMLEKTGSLKFEIVGRRVIVK